LQILISKLRNSLEGSQLSRVCCVLDKIKNKEPDGEIKEEFEEIAREKGCEGPFIETIKNDDGHILLLAMRVINKLLS